MRPSPACIGACICRLYVIGARKTYTYCNLRTVSTYHAVRTLYTAKTSKLTKNGLKTPKTRFLNCLKSSGLQTGFSSLQLASLVLGAFDFDCGYSEGAWEPPKPVTPQPKREKTPKIVFLNCLEPPGLKNRFSSGQLPSLVLRIIDLIGGFSGVAWELLRPDIPSHFAKSPCWQVRTPKGFRTRLYGSRAAIRTY